MERPSSASCAYLIGKAGLTNEQVDHYLILIITKLMKKYFCLITDIKKLNYMTDIILTALGK